MYMVINQTIFSLYHPLYVTFLTKTTKFAKPVFFAFLRKIPFGNFFYNFRQTMPQETVPQPIF